MKILDIPFVLLFRKIYYIIVMSEKVVISEIQEIAADSSAFYAVLFNHWPIEKISYETKISYEADGEHNYLRRIIVTGKDNFARKWNVSYQKTLVFKLSNGREFRFDTTDGEGIGRITNADVGMAIMKFIDDFNHGEFNGPQLEVTNEVEFMDI